MYDIIKHQASPEISRKVMASSPVRDIILHRPRNLSRILEHYSAELLDDNDYCVACKQPAKCAHIASEDGVIHIYPCCNTQHKATIRI